MAIKYEIAKDLYHIGAVQIESDYPFTWTSGIKSPIYCDNRLTLSYPVIREKIAETFVEMIKAMDEQIDVVAGCATAGIPHAAWVAQKLNVPMVYVRSSAKKHGKGNQIEGMVEAGQKVVVLEDLISTGGSALNAVQALQAEGAQVNDVLAIFSYGLTAANDAFAANKIYLQTITNFDLLLDALQAEDELDSQEKEQLLNWRNQLVL